MARAMWRGRLEFEGQQVPVKLFSAVEDHAVHFRLLHEPDGQPVKSVLVNARTGEQVDGADVRKAFELEPRVWVKLDEDELDAVRPPSSRSIEVLRFVAAARIDRHWYDRPYFLGPDGDESAYSALVEALRRSGCEAVVRWVMRKHGYVGALRESGGFLVLYTLKHREEVVRVEALPAITQGKEVQPKERALARQLVAALEGPLELERFKDDYREHIEALVARKAGGKVVPLHRPSKAASADSALSDALRASIDALGRSA